jgi:hypothetical protein
MNIFAIIPTDDYEALSEQINQDFAGSHYELPHGEWLIAFNGTTKELSDRLGISDGQHGSAIIFLVTNYWGFADKNIWEWVATKERQI